MRTQNHTIFQKKPTAKIKSHLKNMILSFQLSTLSSTTPSPQTSKHDSRHISRLPSPPMYLNDFIDYNAITNKNS